MKYFMFSDTHGIDPKIVQNKLDEKGFDKNNNDHCIVLAGDIVDGLNYDNEILEFIQGFDNKIVIKGNHAGGDWDTRWWHNTDYWREITPANKEYLVNLPYQLETKDFFLAHGIYLDLDIPNRESASVNASPVLFGVDKTDSDWVLIDEPVVKTIKNHYHDSIDKYAAGFDKPLILGHFSEEPLLRYTKDADYKLIINEQGFYQYKNIIWLDKRVVDDPQRFDIYIMESK